MLPMGIGFSEVLLILVVLLLVVGPHKLPEIARTLGKGLRTVRKASRDFKDAVQLDDLRREIMSDPKPRRDWARSTSPEDAQLDDPPPPKLSSLDIAPIQRETEPVEHESSRQRSQLSEPQAEESEEKPSANESEEKPPIKESEGEPQIVKRAKKGPQAPEKLDV